MQQYKSINATFYPSNIFKIRDITLTDCQNRCNVRDDCIGVVFSINTECYGINSTRYPSANIEDTTYLKIATETPTLGVNSTQNGSGTNATATSTNSNSSIGTTNNSLSTESILLILLLILLLFAATGFVWYTRKGKKKTESQTSLNGDYSKFQPPSWQNSYLSSVFSFSENEIKPSTYQYPKETLQSVENDLPKMFQPHFNKNLSKMEYHLTDSLSSSLAFEERPKMYSQF